MAYSITEIADITNSRLLHVANKFQLITDYFFDTRRGPEGEDKLFIAIDGNNSDGHAYIDSAYRELGTRSFLVSKEINLELYPDCNVLLTNDVLATLQALATFHRSKFSIPVIGITGSNGKTIIKEWIYQICQSSANIVRSPKSYNSQLGVPLSVLKMTSKNDLAIFEAGISVFGEMKNLEAVIQPTLGIISNIGDAHSAGFNSIEEKLDEKLALFSNCKEVIYCKDDALITSHIKQISANKISWSTKDEDATYLVSFNHKVIQINEREYQIPFTDKISRSNATFSIIAALQIGVEVPKKIDLKALRMRLEMKAGVNNCLLINDAYNSDFDALASALTILNQQEKKDKNTLILSQIEESNLEEDAYLEQIREIISRNPIDRLISLGDKLRSLELELDHTHFTTTEDLIAALDEIHFNNENILIKGARRYNLEQVFKRLSTKVHQTILEIDLEAMRHNLTVYRSFLKAKTKLMVVLKASAYGSGSKELSRFLEFQRVDYIAVAYIDEGVELRKSGIELPIMVMNPEESGFQTMVKYDLEPEIYSIKQLESFTSYLDERQQKIHLKIETGMHRLGLEAEDLEKVVSILRRFKSIKVQSVFSHLVGSDDPDLDHFSQQQINTFTQEYERLTESLGYCPDRHVLNSNGISRFPEFQFEMVRLGIGLHGISDDLKLKDRLQKVQRLSTRIAQVKHLKSGDSVGYNRSYKVTQEQVIGTINIGYADGLPRVAGNKNFSVLINGKRAPIIGNVCMDMCMIDLGGIEANAGAEVVIFGPEHPIEELAKACHTIPYEILTRLSTRIHRIFSRE